MLSLTLPSVPDSISRAAEAVEVAVSTCGLSAEVVGRASLAVAEAVANAIEHGNRQLAYRHVELAITSLDEAVEVTICDGGEGVVARHLATASLPTDPMATDGRGLYLIRVLSDDILVRDSCLRLTFREREA